jgi:hypothetical protein
MVYLVSERFPKSLGLNPALYPKIVAILIICLSLFLIFTSFKAKSEGDGEEEKEGSGSEPNKTKPLFLLLLLILYFIGLMKIGFLIPTIILIALAMRLLDIRNYYKIGGYALVISLIIYFVFNNLLQIPLP